MTTLPEEAETPQIKQPKRRREVLNLTLYGEAPARSLIEQAQVVRISPCLLIRTLLRLMWNSQEVLK
ncbi:MAG: hypothetical protein CM1200mP30_18560 [Pseudomonadota bacterium]|nr:MAG: hypothetical protein CM1200mP30_18560 [Pseudomonadota bacterium]